MKTYNERTQDVLERVEKYEERKKKIRGKFTGKKFIAQMSALAAAIVLIIALNITLFLPYPTGGEISAYKKSEYYPLISVVNDLTYKKPQYKNNFEKLMAGFKDFFGGFGGFGNKGNAAPGTSSGEMMPPTSDSPNGIPDQTYEEITNNQVKGIIEGDLLKRSSEYCYYFLPSYSDYTLTVYRPDGDKLDKISQYKIEPEAKTSFSGYSTDAEMYLSADCTKIIIITQCYFRDDGSVNTCVIELDVSNPDSISEKGRRYISGSYVSSRLVGNSLLVFTKKTVYNNPDFSDESAYLPQTGISPDSMQSLDIEDIIFSENAQYARYTVVCDIDIRTMEIKSNLAFLSYSEEAYVSGNNIFLTQSKSREAVFVEGISYNPRYGYINNYKAHNFPLDKGTYSKNYRFTDITCISYSADGLKLVNTAEVEGEVLNQYSMDEYEGVLRVATTSYNAQLTVGDKPENPDNHYYTFTSFSTFTSASLYCIDLDTFEVAGSVKNFAPKQETVRSARFDGDEAYVCTAVLNTDPVYKFDLSDIQNITQKDTGEISGFSFSLTKFKDGTLLGIGQNWGEFKIELYRESAEGVESVAEYTRICDFPGEYKAYYIDAQRGLIGFSVNRYDWSNTCYLLLLFDGENLVEIEKHNISQNLDNECTRTAYIDGYLYVFTEKECFVINYAN